MRQILAVVAMLWLAVCQGARAEPLSIILLDPQYDASSADGQTSEMTAADLPRVQMLGERLKKAISLSTDYKLMDNPAVSAEIANYNLGACGRCELMLGKKVGAEVVAVISLQKISIQLSNLSVFFYRPEDGATLAAGTIALNSNTDATWRHGIDYLAANRLKLPRPPKG